MRRFLGALALLMLVAGPAGADPIITFEGVADNYDAVQDYGLFSFTFSAIGWGVVTTDFSCCSGDNVQNGSRRLLFSGGSTVPGSVMMARIDGGLFSVSSFHAATAFIDSGGSLTVKGYFPDATSVSTSFEIGDSFAGLALSEAFSGLSSIEFAEGTVAGWREYGVGLDNIDVGGGTPAPIPEPASLLLVGTGLAGLRAWRKRRA